MPLISVPALYDGTSVQLLEQVSVNEPYRVLVTFVEPVRTAARLSELERFWASFGAWQDQEPIDWT